MIMFYVIGLLIKDFKISKGAFNENKQFRKRTI
jgi:hypothetical protein